MSPEFVFMSKQHQTAIGIMMKDVNALNLDDVNIAITKNWCLVERDEAEV